MHTAAFAMHVANEQFARSGASKIVATSVRVRGIIEAQGGELSEAEVCYLEIHLARLSTSGREPQAAPSPEPRG